MKIPKILLVSVILTAWALLPVQATAQINSPYSKFGYGLLNDNATSAQRQMGGVGYAMNSGRQINVMNPASYAFCDTLTFLFDMGLSFTNVKMKETDADGAMAKTSQYGGGVDYITMQVPIARRMGASLGLVPFSSVGYSFGNKIANGVNQRQGSGGLSQLYLGFAGQPLKNLSVGFNLSYLFGTTVNDVYVTTNSGSQSLFEQVMDVRDWRIQFGAQYSLDLNPDNRLTVGVTFAPGKTLLGKARVVKYDINADEEPDTVAKAHLKGNASIPATWGAGINYRWQKRLSVEADFTYQSWSKAKTLDMPNFEATRFANRWQINAGAEFTPALRGSYLKRITYRAGAFYNRDYIMVGTNHVREYGLACGFGLPAFGSKTMINIGFEYRQRQATPNPLLKESYFNIRLGINFNELWFFQNKIN